ncbi:MAG: ferrous iron transport protein A [Phycisphaerae bacterium]|nr:ferrous iron transport protein A [Phycisphaerae bacterium]
MTKTLAELEEGQSARITKIGGQGAIRQRLLDMGIIRGTPIHVERRAPLGDPIEITVKGYYLAIRQQEARFIEVEV